jgi:hypothetical protein
MKSYTNTHTHTYVCVFVCAWVSIALPWIRQSPASEMRAGFDHRSARVSFVVDEVAVEEVSLQVNRSSPVRIILRILHTYLPLRVAF